MSPFLSFTKQKVNKIKHILLNISSEESVQLRVWPSVTNFLNIVKTILPCHQPNIFGMKLKLWSNLSHHWRISVSKKAFKNSWSKEITQSLCTHVFWYLPVTYVIMSVTLMILMAMTLMILTTGGGCRPRVEIIIGRAGGEQERERESKSLPPSPLPSLKLLYSKWQRREDLYFLTNWNSSAPTKQNWNYSADPNRCPDLLVK